MDPWIAGKNRASAEGFSVRDRRVWYLNPEGLNGSGQFVDYPGIRRFAGRVEDFGMCEKTHLFIKSEGVWYDLCIALGQLLDEMSIPKKNTLNCELHY